jgi:methionyl-tRNA synthetase
MTSTYVTVAIPYVNADPHLGYAYELVEADIYARARRRAGDEVRFLGGTDDFSLKNVLAAEVAGEPTQRFVDRHADRFETLAEPLDLSFDDFIRTSSDPRHAPAVERLWRAAHDRGDVYRRQYEGDYCVGCEQFYDPADLVDERCPEHGTSTERIAEDNWFFRLSAYQGYLDELVSSDRLAIRPEPFRREVLAFIRSGLADISVSRSIERARGWGIPVPDDPTQVVYVWFDALTNYISALRFGDPGSADYERWWLSADERVHVIGKGIIRFHSVYWPAFLASAGEPAPTRVQVHPYLTVGGHKLSKSQGSTVDPVRLVADYGTDALRWFFARDVGEVADTDFTVDRLIDRANEDLANALGNTANRVATLVYRYLDGRTEDHETAPAAEFTSLQDAVDDALTEFHHRDATQLIVDAVGRLNADIAATEPWRLTAVPGRRADLCHILTRQLAAARMIVAAAEPIVPGLSTRLARQLGGQTCTIPKPAPQFARLDKAPKTATRR